MSPRFFYMARLGITGEIPIEVPSGGIILTLDKNRHISFLYHSRTAHKEMSRRDCSLQPRRCSVGSRADY